LTPSLLLHTSPLLFASVGISTSQGTSILYGKKAQFTFYQNVSMKSLSPSLGSEFGGTQVKIYGYFPRSKDISCAFDGIRSLGQWISTDVIICESPAAKGTFLYSPIVPVTIALNGQDEESMSLPFQYMLGAHVSSVIPSFGMAGTKVNIYGEGFLFGKRTAFCAIGTSLSDATIINNELATCIIPSRNSTEMFVVVSLNATHLR